MEQFSFRKIIDGDAERIRNWIKENEFVRRWYFHCKIPRIRTINKKINRENVDSYIVLLNDIEIGYIQCYSIDGWGSWSNKVKIHNESYSVGIDYYIGDKNHIHMGYGPKMLTQFIDKIIKPLNCDYLIITPDKENIVSRKCCEKCGLKFVKEVHVPYENSKHVEAVYIKKMKK